MGAYEKLAEKFHEVNPTITVQVIFIEEILELSGEDWDWPEDTDRQLMSAADTLATWMYPDMTHQGLAHDLTPFIETERNFMPEDFYPGTLEGLQWDSGIWGLPGTLDFKLIFYDKEAFDAADVPYPAPGWTWDDFLEKAILLTERKGDEVTRWGFVEAWPDPSSFVVPRIGSLVDDSTTTPTPLLDQPAVAEAVRWYTDLHLEHRVMPYFEPPESESDEPFMPEGYTLIEDGKAVMWADSSDSFAWRSQEKEVGMEPYPVKEPGDATTSLSTWSVYVMSAGTAHPEEAWRWLDFEPPD
jgi:multiple sugar transport system substrate-binding protein